MTIRNSIESISHAKVKEKRWQPSQLRDIFAKLLAPLFYFLNRPSLSWFAHAAYDFAIRCNGIAINFPGKSGLTIAEHNFLKRIASDIKGGIVLDVGANSGNYAAALSKLAPEARIYCFEPHPKTFEKLHARFNKSPVKVINAAMAEIPGKMVLHDFADSDGSTQASLSRASVDLYSDKSVAHQVTVETVDGFLLNHQLNEIDFLKIDTEGFDINVIRGARRAIAEKRVKIIQFEFIAANLVNNVSMRDFFSELNGYAISRLCMNGEEMPLGDYNVKRHEIFVNQNLIARPIA